MVILYGNGWDQKDFFSSQFRLFGVCVHLMMISEYPFGWFLVDHLRHTLTTHTSYFLCSMNGEGGGEGGGRKVRGGRWGSGGSQTKLFDWPKEIAKLGLMLSNSIDFYVQRNVICYNNIHRNLHIFSSTQSKYCMPVVFCQNYLKESPYRGSPFSFFLSFCACQETSNAIDSISRFGKQRGDCLC